MIEHEILTRWAREKPIYAAWGDHVKDTICSYINDQLSYSMRELFLRLPVSPRLKSDNSLIEKALYRGKGYRNPYEDITDKVGLRIVVLLETDVRIVESVIESIPGWEISRDRDPNEQKSLHPEVFDYLATHYVVRNKKPLELKKL